MIPTVLKSQKVHPDVAFRRVIEYVGRDDSEAREKGHSPLTEESCGVFNMDADCGTTEDRELIWQIMAGDAAIATDYEMPSRSHYRGNPLYYFDMSWMEGEHPTRKQLEKTVQHITEGLGFGKCPTFWAVHRDTDNDHLHVVVNKVIVDPETGEITIAEKPRFDYRELHRLTREVEIAQGWQHAPGYFVAVEPQPGDKKIMTRQEAIGRGLWNEDWEKQKKISRAAGRVEKYLGAESFQTWVVQEPAQRLFEIINEPGATWDKVHGVLAQFGIVIEPKGSGMIVKTTLDDGKVLAAKASQMGKWASKVNLEKQLGSYAPPSMEVQQSVQSAQITYEQVMHDQRLGEQLPGSADSNSKRAVRKAERAVARKALVERFERERKGQQKEWRQQQRAALREHHQQERRVLSSQLAEQRRQLFRDAKAAHQRVESVQLAMHARERALQLEILQARQVEERKLLTKSMPSVASTWREWLEQQAERGDEAAQAALRGIRYQEQRKKRKPDNTIEGEEQEDRQKVITIAQFRAEVDRRRQQVIYKSADGTTCFIDEGPRLVVRDNQTDTMEAALRVAAAKYRNQIAITGTKQFREEAARRATRLGVTVKNADLQIIVEAEKSLMKERFQHGRGRQR